MYSFVTLIFPLAALVYLLITSWGWLPLVEQERLPAPPPGSGAEPKPKPPLRFTAPGTALSFKDVMLMAAITVIYAAVAFTGLGSTEAPQSVCKFKERGSYADIQLPEETHVSGVMYYCSLHTGSYYLQVSDDGESWQDAAVLSQSYADVFKWMTPEEQNGFTTKYIRLISDDELWLGELALYDGSGELIDASSFICDSTVAALFDEQDKVPSAYDYMNSTYFDEIYHARTAYEHIEGVYPYEITHPPLGKLIIAAGIKIFGMNPFGWRFSGTLFGALMLPVIYLLLFFMFGSTAVAACCTAVFAFDFMHFVQTRIATIDTYSVFFILLMYLFMWLYVSDGKKRYLALSGLAFGLGAASKWTCMYAGAGLGVIWLISWIMRRRESGFWKKILKNCLFCVVFFVLIPVLIYYLSYFPYGESRGLTSPGMFFTRDYAGIVIDNQKYMWNYHSGLVAEHPYSSRWYQWIVDARPILYYFHDFGDGTKSSFGAWMSPLLCWGGLFAMLLTSVRLFTRRDGKCLFILVGYLAQLLPWVLITRLTFEYHYFPSEVFLVLALGLMFSGQRRELGRRNTGLYAFTALSLLLFAVFYPDLTGLRVSSSYSGYFLKWLPDWPF